MKRSFWSVYGILFLFILFIVVPIKVDFSGTTRFLSWGFTEAEAYDYYLPYYLSNQNYWTGVALKNGSSTETASVTVYGINQSGSLVDSQAKTISPNGQTAFNMKSGEGWVKITADQTLTGLSFVAEDSGDALMFDITLITELATVLNVPHVAQNESWDTIVYVCNPNESDTTMYITFVKSDGMVVTSREYTIPVNGSGKYPLSDLLEGSTYSSGSIEITASQGVAAFALYQNLKTGAHSYAGISAVPSINGGENSIRSLPFTISSPGFYYITKDLTCPTGTHGIIITADDVTLDLMGFSLVGPGGSGNYDGIYMNASTNIEIRNGIVRNFTRHGIYEASVSGAGHRLNNIRARDNGGAGIYLHSQSDIIESCMAWRNGDCGININNGSTVTNNTCYNNSMFGILTLSGCTVTGNTCYDNAENGIMVGPGSTVIGNTCYKNGSYGIYLQRFTLVDQNTTYDNGAGNINSCISCNFGINVAP